MKKTLTAVLVFAAVFSARCSASIILHGIFPYQPPEARPFIKVTAYSITAAWGTGTNDASCRYECENSTASAFLPPSSGAVSWESAGLIPGTSYAFRARAWDDNASPPSATSWTDLGSVFTTGRIKVQGTNLSDGGNISSIPDISFSFRNYASVNPALCKVLIDDVEVTDGSSANGKYDSIITSSGITTLFYTPKTKISGNNKKISVELTDINGTLYTESVSALQVRDSSDTEFKITSVPLCYPNPFDPDNGDIKIAYELSRDGNTGIFILDGTGRVIYRRQISSGENGARYGYNEVSWNGNNAYGETVNNDVYLICIADGAGKTLGKTRVMVLK